MNRPLPAFFAALLLAVPALAFALSDRDKADLREFAAVQHMDDMWPQMVPKLSTDTMRWVRDFAEKDIDESTALPPDVRTRAKAELDRFMPAARDEFRDYLKTFDYRALADYLAVDVYGSLVDVSQIREVTAFYKTPTGRKLTRLTPEIMQATSAGEKNVMEKRFTAPELAQLTTFYKSAAEQRVLAVSPQVQPRIKAYWEKQIEAEVHQLEKQVVTQAVKAASP